MESPIAFDKAMHGIYQRALSEAGYRASAFLQMLMRDRGVLTAKKLINAPKVSEGYTRLSQLERIDLTVEALVVENRQWHYLFTADELVRAEKRLKDYHYTPKATI